MYVRTVPAYLIELMVGIMASRIASTASGRQASKRDAPNARNVSVLSRFSLQKPRGIGARSARREHGKRRQTNSSSFRIKLCATIMPPIEFPHSIPTTGTENVQVRIGVVG